MDAQPPVESSRGWLVRVRSLEALDTAALGDVVGLASAVHRLAPVLPVLTRPGASVPFSSAAELLAVDAGRGLPLWRHAVAYEMQRGGLDERDVVDRMVAIVRLLRASIAAGVAGTSYDDRVLPAQAPAYAAAVAAGRHEARRRRHEGRRRDDPLHPPRGRGGGGRAGADGRGAAVGE